MLTCCVCGKTFTGDAELCLVCGSEMCPSCFASSPTCEECEAEMGDNEGVE
jgi:hypothetical protein